MKNVSYKLKLKMNTNDKIIGLSLFDFNKNIKYAGEKIIKDYQTPLPLYQWTNQNDNIRLVDINEGLFNDLLNSDFRKIENMNVIDFFKKFKIEELAL